MAQRNKTALPLDNDRSGSTQKPRSLGEIAAEMASLDQGDPEASHARADDLLIEAIRRLVTGDYRLVVDTAERLIESWRSVEKWYA
jgi:hypothetical protein